MGTLKPQSSGPIYSNTVIGTLAADGGGAFNNYVTLQGGGAFNNYVTLQGGEGVYQV